MITNDLIRLQNLIPSSYVAPSRDFQLICRLYDCLFNGVKNDTDTMITSINTQYISSRLLPLLSSKLGFFINNNLSDENLRILLTGYPLILKNKGSKRGIRYAINTFAKIKNIKSEIDVTVDNEQYVISIFTEDDIDDLDLLINLLQDILPTGYSYKHVYFTADVTEDAFEIEDSVTATII